ncbi:hypothetical protein [Nocardia sp. NPDC002869]|uniref:hypothetical protein n=1 Tax=Nocardia sp. NPDC002869 TaxID=3161032 RepID=UPI00398D1EA9
MPDERGRIGPCIRCSTRCRRKLLAFGVDMAQRLLQGFDLAQPLSLVGLVEPVAGIGSHVVQAW